MSNSEADVVATSRDSAERRQASDDREYLAAIVESSADAIVGTDLNALVTSWNAGATAIFGYPAGEMIGTSITRLLTADQAVEEERILERLRCGERIELVETRRRARDGRLIDVSVLASPIRDAAGRVVGAARIMRDMSELTERERELARMSRLYAALGQVNQAIVQAPSRAELFQRVCRALAEQGGFSMAWVAWLDPASRELVPAAASGDEHGFLKTIRVFADERPEGLGPSGVAFRSGTAAICNDTLNDPAIRPWWPELERRGYRAAAAFPIRQREEVVGTLTVYADTQGFFHDKEIALLEEAATDLSFALDNLVREEERRQAEQRLEESERQYRELVEHANSIILRWSSDGRILFLNEFGLRFFGYSADEIVGQRVMDTIAPSTESTGRDLSRLIDDICANPAAFEQSINENIRSNGERVWIAWSNHIARDAEGQVVEILSVGTDVTERKKADTALREAELRFHTLFEHTPVGILVIDAGSGAIVECNRLAAWQLGYGAEELCRLHISELHGLWPTVDTQARIDKVVRDGKDEFETQHKSSSGELRDIAVTTRLVELAGRDVVYCVALDVTARKHAQLERDKRHRAEAADRIKSAFLATMSHELRTPLNSIIGFTGIILQGLAGPLNPEQQKQLDIVRSSARHLLALVNDVLDISKIEAGQFDVAREAFDVGESIARVVAQVRPQVAAKGLELRVEVTSGLGTACSDQRRFEQILFNLLHNAVKFTDRGEITLSAKSVTDCRREGAETEEPAVRLCVSDSGIGIKAEDLPTLFQPFRQVDSGLSRKHEGTGLGLAICRRLAELMGGQIEVESEWGKGSTFSVTLPLNGPVRP